MNNTNTHSADVNIIEDIATQNNAHPQEERDVGANAPVSAAEAFAKSCEEIKAFCPQDEYDQPGDVHLQREDHQPFGESGANQKIAELFRAKIASKLNFDSCLPQIAIKIKDTQSPNGNNTQVVLLNGNWDTSSEIPNIVAEMHNVNLEELQVLKGMTMSHDNSVVDCSGTGMGGKQMKLDSSLMDDPSGFSSVISSGVSSGTSAITGTPSPLGSDSGIEGDSTDGNLSWLLNYKINELPPVPEQHHNPSPPVVPMVQNMVQSMPDTPKQHALMAVDPNIQYRAVDEHGNVIELQNKGYATMPAIQTHQDAQQYQFLANNPPTGVAKYTGPKKPPFTYTELIEHALVEKGELTVSGIYQWISDHFPFYKQNDDRWKNSVRHNLSINPHFRKGSKAVHGAGHLWTIAQKDEHHSWQIKRQKMQQFIKNTHGKSSTEKLHEIELANATASILPSETDKRMQPENVAIEYVIDMSGGLGVVSLDFLCPPVTKEQVVEECGLTGDYLITDLHPAALGLNMGDGEILHATHLYDDLNFPAYELQGE